uniref:(California timema) hypothetical protein n=1 Tax=Timema californicum TaxID=61474 RepID=A0A7R9J1P7_TIMCA|nr:unnamed protein product [Timema californicum]
MGQFPMRERPIPFWFRRRSAMNAMDQERFQTQDDKRDDSEDDIPVIPDLDDLQDDQLDSQVAVAPSVAVNRVATYKELDSDLLKHSAFATLDDINLQLLTKRLNLEADVKEISVSKGIQSLSQRATTSRHKANTRIKLETLQFHHSSISPADETPASSTSNTDPDWNSSETSSISCMAPASSHPGAGTIALYSPDEVWTWDLLFTEVSSELRKEWEAKSEISPDKDNATKQSESHN